MTDFYTYDLKLLGCKCDKNSCNWKIKQEYAYRDKTGNSWSVYIMNGYIGLVYRGRDEDFKKALVCKIHTSVHQFRNTGFFVDPVNDFDTFANCREIIKNYTTKDIWGIIRKSIEDRIFNTNQLTEIEATNYRFKTKIN